MTVGDDGPMRGVGRRGVLVGIVGSLLAACGLGGRSDVGAVQDALRTAVEALPGHLGGCACPDRRGGEGIGLVLAVNRLRSEAISMVPPVGLEPTLNRF